MDVAIPLEKLTTYIEQQDFKGYDPYDALNSPLLSFLSFGRKYPRIAFTQALKRSPINLRPLLFVPKGINPKGRALFLWGYAKLHKQHAEHKFLPQIQHLLNLLEQSKSPGHSGNSWGYNFDWQSRAFFIPKNTPAIVNTSFVGHALLDTYAYTDETKALDMAVPIAEDRAVNADPRIPNS